MNRLTPGVMAVYAVALFVNPVVAQPSGHEGPPDPRGTSRPQDPLMMALDTDKDGMISAAEIEAAGSLLNTLDQNNDGKLTPGEMRPSAHRFRGRSHGDPNESSHERPSLPKTEAEKKILSVLDDMDRNQRKGMMNVPVSDGRLLRLLTEAIGAKRVVELGTSNGYSAIWLCLALRKTGGKLTTYEIDAYRASLARDNFKRAGVSQIVTLVEGDAHVEVTKLKEPIDLVFLDADKKGYVDYLNKLLPLIRPGGLIVGHNMVRPAPAPAYIDAITTNPDLESIFLNMDAAGVCVTLKKR